LTWYEEGKFGILEEEKLALPKGGLPFRRGIFLFLMWYEGAISSFRRGKVPFWTGCFWSRRGALGERANFSSSFHVKSKKIPLQKGDFPQTFITFIPLQTFPYLELTPFSLSEKSSFALELFHPAGRGRLKPCNEV